MKNKLKYMPHYVSLDELNENNTVYPTCIWALFTLVYSLGFDYIDYTLTAGKISQ